MRIAILTPDMGGRSGWSRYALDLGRALKEQGHEIHAIVHQTSDDDWSKQHAILRPPTSYLGSGLLCRFGAWRLSLLLRRIKPDVVHVIAEPYALMLPFIRSRPWRGVMTIHGTYAVAPLRFPKVRHLYEQAYHLLDRIISVSNYTKNRVKTDAGAIYASAKLEEKIVVIHNAIDLSAVDKHSDRKRSKKSIISVSAIKRKKGYVEALRALALFIQNHVIDVHYDMYGSLEVDPAFVQELRRTITELRLEKYVTLHGSVTDEFLSRAYERADLFILPSLHEGDYFEGFGLVFLEANARGVPVIGPTTGGCPEAIEDGKSGYVCDPTDIRALSERMRDILIQETISPKSCMRWAAEHDIRDAAKQIASTYLS